MRGNRITLIGVYEVIQIDPARDEKGELINYHVVNTKTGAVEYQEQQLPNAIHVATTLNALLESFEANGDTKEEKLASVSDINGNTIN